MEITVKNILKIVTVTIATVIYFISSGVACAFQYYDDKPLVYTYQNKHGGWFACGPTQCTQVSEKKEKEAMSYVFDPRRHGGLEWVGNSGRCRVFVGTGNLESWDHEPRKIIKFMKNDC
jgi:hypothetical protein